MSRDTEKESMAGESPALKQPPEHSFEEGEEAAPPGVRTMAMVRWAILLAVIVAAFFSLYTYAAPLLGQSTSSSQQTAKYFCPMHPQITSDRPGECPICHMSLEPMPAQGPKPAPSSSMPDVPAANTSAPKPRTPPPSRPSPSAAASGTKGSSAAPAGYTCLMHPQVHSDTPGRCPICGMDLVPVSTLKSDTLPSASPAAPPDTAPITLTLDRIQAIGVRTAKVERQKASDSLRVTAVVNVPEQGRAEVHTRAPGYVESIHVRDTGVKVKAGEALASIYSPEVFQAQQELIAMGAWTSPAAPAQDAGVAKPAIAAAKRKLELLGLGKDTIDRIVSAGKPMRAVAISTPIAGYVVKKNIVLGSYVMPDKALFEVADLSRVYIIANLYPYQLSGVHVGDRATFTAPSLPGKVLETKADLIYPDVDLATRTTRVRFQVSDKDLTLLPGQFGTIELRGAGAEALTIPMDAVIDTGRSVYVFLAEDGGRFTARVVELGEQINDRFVVKSGLQEGERVVSGATFLIDAESRLQASLAGSTPPPAGSTAPTEAPAPVAAPPSACDAEFDREKFADKWQECRKCEAVHHGMGTMEQDCKNAIPKPWR
jgi:Cu(I)/Ag(I) efflux system membrane fusion protein